MISWVIKYNGVPVQQGKSNAIPCSLQFSNHMNAPKEAVHITEQSPVYLHMKEYDIQYLDLFQKQLLNDSNVSKVVVIMKDIIKTFTESQNADVQINIFLIKVIDAWVYLSNIGSIKPSNFHHQFTKYFIEFIGSPTKQALFGHIYKLIMSEAIQPTDAQVAHLESMITYFTRNNMLHIPFQPITDTSYVAMKLACRYMIKLNSQTLFQRSITPPRDRVNNPVSAPDTPPQLKRILRK
jgi:hypothetical protein